MKLPWSSSRTAADAVANSIEKLTFLKPERRGLPSLELYSHLRQNGTKTTAGYTEASRGCKHLCRHCPVVPVYEGQFRVVQREVVLADIRQQVAAGARHITFGDPDFFNGPTHAMRIVEAFHAEFPEVTYDATIKIEHLKQHRDLLPALKQTGCLFVTSAVESIDDAVLGLLEKGHTRQDFYEVATSLREAGLALQPTFIAFMPWTTIEGYGALLQAIADLELVENTAPVQLALRLLVTQKSRLLDLPEIQAVIGPFDEKALVYPWKHRDRDVDTLANLVFQLVSRRQEQNKTRAEIFGEIWELVLRTPAPTSAAAAVPPVSPSRRTLVLLRRACPASLGHEAFTVGRGDHWLSGARVCRGRSRARCGTRTGDGPLPHPGESLGRRCCAGSFRGSPARHRGSGGTRSVRWNPGSGRPARVGGRAGGGAAGPTLSSRRSGSRGVE